MNDSSEHTCRCDASLATGSVPASTGTLLEALVLKQQDLLYVCSHTGNANNPWVSPVPPKRHTPVGSFPTYSPLRGRVISHLTSV